MRRFLICLALLFVSVSAPAAEQPLRIAVDVPYPPFAFKDEQGELTGFDIEIGRALCAAIGRQCIFIDIPFDEILPSIAADKADISIAGMGDTPERRKLVDFTEKYFRSHSIYIERPGTIKGLKPADLKGKRIAVQKNTLQETYAKDVFKQSSILTFTRHDEAFDALKKGEADLVLVDGLPGYEFLKSPEGANFETVGPPVTSGVLTGDSLIAVSKKLPELRAALNEAIQAIRRNGEYGRINRKYFDFTVY